MSRFANLEFEGESDKDLLRQQASPRGEEQLFSEAQSTFANGNFEVALRLYSKVLAENPGNVAAWVGQVRMLIELDELREAQLWADKALERFPSDPALLAAKGVALARSGAVDEALALSDASIQERGDTPYLWLARGDVLLARKEQRADYCFEKALMLAPGDWFTAWLAGRVRFYYNQAAHALKLLQRALELNAGHFLLWLEMGRCQQALGLVGPAQVSFSRARELNPLCPEIGAAMAELAETGWLSRLAGWCKGLFR